MCVCLWWQVKDTHFRWWLLVLGTSYAGFPLHWFHFSLRFMPSHVLDSTCRDWIQLRPFIHSWLEFTNCRDFSLWRQVSSGAYFEKCFVTYLWIIFVYINLWNSWPYNLWWYSVTQLVCSSKSVVTVIVTVGFNILLNTFIYHFGVDLKSVISCQNFFVVNKQDAQLSQRDRAAGCVIVSAKSGRLELGDNILRKL